MEVDLRLAKADFGEDHVPLDPSYLFKSIVSVKEKIPQHLKDKIEAIEEIDDYDELPLPPMRNDILGLNHATIMQKVNQSSLKHRLQY